MDDYRNRIKQVNGTRRKRSAGVEQLSEADRQLLQGGTSLEDVVAASAVKRMPACGMQLYACEKEFHVFVSGSLACVRVRRGFMFLIAVVWFVCM